MRTTFGINLLGVVNNQPKVFNLKELLQHFLDHRRDVVLRRTAYDLARARERAHILEGLVIALDNLDAVIALIRGAADPEAARTGLMKEFGLSQVQAQAILDMRLQRLTGLERDKIVEEHAEVRQLILHLEAVLDSEDMVAEIIVEELAEVKKKYGDERCTEIIEDPSEISIEDLIAEPTARNGAGVGGAAAWRSKTKTRSGSSSWPPPTRRCCSSHRPAASSRARSMSCPMLGRRRAVAPS
jgi:DNA gyrase subunit A